MRTFPCILVLISLAGCMPPKPASVRIDPALAILVPGDSTVLAGVRIESLKDTALWKKYVDQQPLPQLDQFVQESGLDPRQDLYEMLYASNGKDSVMMARGKFSPTGGTEPRVNIKGAKRFVYKTYTLIGGDEGAMTFMNPSVAIAGPVEVLKRVIDNRGQTNGIPGSLAELVNGIPVTNQIWVASTAGIPLPVGRMPQVPPNVTSLLQFVRGVRTATLAANLRAGLNLTARADSATPDDARHLHDAIRGGLGFARLQTPENQPDLLRAYDSIQVTMKDRSVTVGADLAADQLEKIGVALEKLAKAVQ